MMSYMCHPQSSCLGSSSRTSQGAASPATGLVRGSPQKRVISRINTQKKKSYQVDLGSKHEAEDDGGADSDAHAQARQLHLRWGNV